MALRSVVEKWLSLSPTAHIALRFLLEHKRSMALSAAGVIFGVGFFIAAQAQTSGFQKYFVDTTLGSSGSVVISERFQMTYSKLLDENKGDLVTVNNPQSRKYYPGIDDVYHKIDALMKYSNVEG
jgi:lipoprotein-releasing system permease protein